MCIFFFDFLHFDMSLLLLTVSLRGVSNKHCLLFLFSLFLHMQKAGFLMMRLKYRLNCVDVHKCAGLSAPLLFALAKKHRVLHDNAH